MHAYIFLPHPDIPAAGDNTLKARTDIVTQPKYQQGVYVNQHDIQSQAPSSIGTKIRKSCVDDSDVNHTNNL